MARARKPPRVEVVWLDAITHPGPFKLNVAAAESPLIERHTIGYLVSNDETCIRIAQTFDPAENEVADVTTIPAPWIVKRKRLRVKHGQG